MNLAAVILMIPIQISTSVSLHGPNGDVHYIVLLRWPGEPHEVSLEGLPSPELRNLDLVGISVRRRSGPGGTIMEINYRLRPIGAGRARIAATRFACGVGDQVTYLAAEPVGFEVPAASGPKGGRMYWLLLLLLPAGAGIWYGFKRRRGVEPLLVVNWHERLAGEEIVSLVDTARRYGIAVPPLVSDACEAFKFGREEPDQDLVRRFRTELAWALRDRGDPAPGTRGLES